MSVGRRGLQMIRWPLVSLCCLALALALLPDGVFAQGAGTFTGRAPAVSFASQANQANGGSTSSDGGVALDSSGNQFYALTSSATGMTFGSSSRTWSGTRVSVWKLNPGGKLAADGLLAFLFPRSRSLHCTGNTTLASMVSTTSVTLDETAEVVSVSASTGYVYLGGTFGSSSITFPSAMSVTNGGSSSGFVVCMDNSLTPLWAWSIRTPSSTLGDAKVKAVALDDANQYAWVVGYFSFPSVQPFSHSSGLAGSACSNSGSDDIFIVRLHSQSGSYQNMYCKGMRAIRCSTMRVQRLRCSLFVL
jgi:hypothetical protein